MDRKNKKGFSPIIILLLLLVVGGAVGAWYFLNNNSASTTKNSQANLAPTGETMKIAKYYWPGTFWVEIAEEKGFFEEEGLKVEIVDTNPDYFASLQSTVDGKIDANNFPLYDLLNYIVSGEDMSIVFNGDVSVGATGIVADKDITDIAQLKGKRIGASDNTLFEYMLEEVLKRNNMQLSDVQVADEFMEKTVDLMRADKVDAMFTAEPFLSNAKNELGANIIFDTSELFGLDSSIWALRKDFIESRPGDVQAFVNVWAKTTNYMKKNENEAFQIIADNYGVTLEDVKGYASMDKILTVEEAKNRFNYSTGIDSIHGLLIGMNEFMIAQEVTDTLVRTETIVDDDFINAVE